MIKDFCSGECVSFPALVRKKECKVKKNGEEYYNLVLCDKSGSITAKVWVPRYASGIEVGCIAWVNNASVSEYNDELQVTINEVLECVTDADPMEFCTASKYDREGMWNALLAYVDAVENVWCKKLLKSFTDDESFKRKFCAHGAGESVHGAYVGGLLEHTLGVTRLSSFVCKVYPWLNRDLIVTSSILHDVGKLNELSPFPENSYTEQGRYVGHVVGSACKVIDACNGIEGFPVDVRLKLEHCILAHHGKLEFGSPKLPVIPEALVISTMDNLEAKLNIFANTAKQGEWSSYNRYLEGYVTLGGFVDEERDNVSQ